MRKIDSLLLNIDVKQFFNDLSDPNVSFEDLNNVVEIAKSKHELYSGYFRGYYLAHREHYLVLFKSWRDKNYNRQEHTRYVREWRAKRRSVMTEEMIKAEKEERNRKDRERYARKKAEREKAKAQAEALQE